METRKKKDFTPYLLALVALILAVIAWNQDGIVFAWKGILAGGEILLSVIPLLIAAFLTAGLIQSLVTRELVTRWLGASSGWRGLLLACIGGALIPGGPYVYYPITGVLLQTGAGLGVLVSFILAKNLWSLSRIPLEIALLGPQLTIYRYAITFVIPPVLGFLAESLFGRYLNQIREGAKR